MYKEQLKQEDIIEIIKEINSTVLDATSYSLDAAIFNTIKNKKNCKKLINNCQIHSKIFLINETEANFLTENRIICFSDGKEEEIYSFKVPTIQIERKLGQFVNSFKINKDITEILFSDFLFKWRFSNISQEQIDRVYYEYMYKKFGDEYLDDLKSHIIKRVNKTADKVKNNVDENLVK